MQVETNHLLTEKLEAIDKETDAARMGTLPYSLLGKNKTSTRTTVHTKLKTTKVFPNIPPRHTAEPPEAVDTIDTVTRDAAKASAISSTDTTTAKTSLATTKNAPASKTTALQIKTTQQERKIAQITKITSMCEDLIHMCRLM